MRKWLVRTGVVVILVWIAIQFVPVAQTDPPVEGDIPTSPTVKAILRGACYDCHSHETMWPWYRHIAPISWLLSHDVQEGRAELNFSTWEQYTPQQQVKKLKESWEAVHAGDMPPWSYRALHRRARLSAQDRERLRSWAVPP
jgi:Haem-binding domain